MASKNLGAVIQRAISDGAFRRQLQSDPAAALRGFNLSPDEIAAVRSGDSSKLMSLGVDQRMSKAFSLGGAGGSQATRAAMSGDVSGSTSNALVGDNTSGAREGIVGDPTSGARAATTTTQGDSYRAVNDPDNTGGTRETVTDPTAAGTRSADSTGQQDSYRAVNDPDNTGGTRETLSAGQQDTFRAVNDPDGTSGARETVSGQLQDSPRAINDPDNAPLSTHMEAANVDLPASDVQQDPGFVDTDSTIVPDGTGDAIGHTDHSGINS